MPTAFLKKPLDFDRLLELVRTLLPLEPGHASGAASRADLPEPR